MTFNVIFAEDSEFMRLTIRDEITAQVPSGKYEFVENGKGLVERVRVGDYCCVITDNDMPLMGGIQAIREIRKFNPNIPIYMLSGSGAIREAMRAGANGFLDKDQIYDGGLAEVVKRHLKSSGNS